MVALRTSAVERLLKPANREMSAQLAEYLLDFEFTSEDRLRCRVLSDKAQSGALTTDEQIELSDLVTANDLLAILKIKARVAQHKSPAA